MFVQDVQWIYVFLMRISTTTHTPRNYEFCVCFYSRSIRTCAGTQKCKHLIVNIQRIRGIYNDMYINKCNPLSRPYDPAIVASNSS